MHAATATDEMNFIKPSRSILCCSRQRNSVSIFLLRREAQVNIALAEDAKSYAAARNLHVSVVRCFVVANRMKLASNGSVGRRKWRSLRAHRSRCAGSRCVFRRRDGRHANCGAPETDQRLSSPSSADVGGTRLSDAEPESHRVMRSAPKGACWHILRPRRILRDSLKARCANLRDRCGHQRRFVVDDAAWCAGHADHCRNVGNDRNRCATRQRIAIITHRPKER